MSSRRSRLILLRATIVSFVALASAAVTVPADATTPPLELTLTGPHSGVTTFTLPATDGFRDSAEFRITAARKVNVDIALNAEGTIVRVIHAGTLAKATDGYAKSVTITDAHLYDSGYDIDAYVHGTTDVADKAPSLPAQVSNGKISTLSITQPTVYPDEKGSASTLTSVFTATDDRGTAIPLHDANLSLGCPNNLSPTGSRTAKEESSKDHALSLALRIPLYRAPAPFTPADCSSGSNLVASAEGPADTGPQFQHGTATLQLAQLTSESAVPKFTVVYPKKDGYYDTSQFTVEPSPAVGESLAASGYVDVLAPGTNAIIKKFTISKLPQTFSWNGRVGSRIVPGLFHIQPYAREADNTSLVEGDAGTVTVFSTELHKHTASKGWQEATDLVGQFNSGTPISGQPAPNCEIDSHERLVCDGSKVDASASATNVSASATLDQFNLPAGVVTADADGPKSVGVTAEIDTTALTGHGRIETTNNGVTRDFALKLGDHVYHLPALYDDGTGLHVTIGAVEASTFTIPKLKFTFVYYTLS